MAASNYLPPFTAEERVTIAGGQRGGVVPRRTAAADGSEATYADFLGDEVDDDDQADQADRADRARG